jgi:DNA-directed RNA polymerase subunit K/omega
VLLCFHMEPTDETPEVPSEPAVEEPVQRPQAPPIDSRFLFVDVAAMRAKQLRRGARLRLNEEDGWDSNRPTVYKAERLAMEEVKHGLVLYEVPPSKNQTA